MGKLEDAIRFWHQILADADRKLGRGRVRVAWRSPLLVEVRGGCVFVCADKEALEIVSPSNQNQGSLPKEPEEDGPHDGS